MDPISEARLASITSQEPNAITEADAAFLRARRPYLTSDQAAKFAEALEAQAEPESKGTTEESEKPKQPKK